MVDLCKIILWNYGFMYGFNWDFTKKNWVQHPTVFLGLFHEIWGKIPAIEMGQIYAVYTAKIFRFQFQTSLSKKLL